MEHNPTHSCSPWAWVEVPGCPISLPRGISHFSKDPKVPLLSFLPPPPSFPPTLDEGPPVDAIDGPLLNLGLVWAPLYCLLLVIRILQDKEEKVNYLRRRLEDERKDWEREIMRLTKI